MKNTKPEILISKRRINTTVRRLAREITRDYADKKPLVVGVLKGSFVFMSDLVRCLDFPLEIDFLRVSSYGQGTESSHRVTLKQAISIPVKNRHVLLVEDIIDTGLSMDYVKRILENEQPASLKICCFLDKPSRRETSFTPDYLGIEVPDKFIVGYGLDFAEQYRNLPDICVLEDK
jgi:hypoxanthine phosphoribosyltransferase